MQRNGIFKPHTMSLIFRGRKSVLATAGCVLGVGRRSVGAPGGDEKTFASDGTIEDCGTWTDNFQKN